MTPPPEDKNLRRSVPGRTSQCIAPTVSAPEVTSESLATPLSSFIPPSHLQYRLAYGVASRIHLYGSMLHGDKGLAGMKFLQCIGKTCVQRPTPHTVPPPLMRISDFKVPPTIQQVISIPWSSFGPGTDIARIRLCGVASHCGYGRTDGVQTWARKKRLLAD